MISICININSNSDRHSVNKWISFPAGTSNALHTVRTLLSLHHLTFGSPQFPGPPSGRSTSNKGACSSCVSTALLPLLLPVLRLPDFFPATDADETAVSTLVLLSASEAVERTRAALR